jgi:hypothetical protein
VEILVFEFGNISSSRGRGELIRSIGALFLQILLVSGGISSLGRASSLVSEISLIPASTHGARLGPTDEKDDNRKSIVETSRHFSPESLAFARESIAMSNPLKMWFSSSRA